MKSENVEVSITSDTTEGGRSESDKTIITNLDNDKIKLTFKSINNTSTDIWISVGNKVKDEITQILSMLKASEQTHEIKLIFGGKLLSNDNTFSSYGLKQDHTILYMLKEKENINAQNNININTNEEVQSNLSLFEGRNINENNLRNFVTQQGFSRFRNYGMSPDEIHALRVMFHTNYLVNNREIARSAWDPHEVIRREEEWINQIHNEEGGNEESAMRRISSYGLGARIYNYLQENRANIVINTVVF